MANCYVQIRCGMGRGEMTVGREYDFSVGGRDTKISPNDMLEFLEKACEKAIQETFGGVCALNKTSCGHYVRPPAPPADKTPETTPETWMPEARQIAAQCWCDDETKNTVMDVVLANAVAKRIAAWMDVAAWAQRNCDYYRGLVIRCGNALGDAAKTCDDGSTSEDVLCAKVPELVEALVANARGMGSSTAPYPGRTVGQEVKP